MDKKHTVTISIYWRDSAGHYHHVVVERLRVLPGDKVDSRLSFTFVGDDDVRLVHFPDD